MNQAFWRRGALTAAAAALAVSVAACGATTSDSTTAPAAAPAPSAPGAPPAAKPGGTIALLLPETKTTRYEEKDKPAFEAKVASLCPDCKVLYSNASQDAAKQQQQAEAALTNGAKVLVLDPVDSKSAAGIVNKARQKNVPVISYDRLILGAPVDYYVSFDNEKVGQLQGQALVDKLKADGKTNGNIVMINGSPTDNNAGQFKAGAHSVLDSSGYTIAKEYDTPDWSPDKAQTEMDQALTAVGKDKIVGVYAANDGVGGAAVASLKNAGVDPKTIPVTGQDAETAGLQRILTGEQYMTVYKAITPEANAAAELAVALVRGEQPPAGLINGESDNNSGQIPSVLLEPVAVTKDNIADTVIKDNFVTAAKLCAGPAAQACSSLGIG